jgi:hypothetical protein
MRQPLENWKTEAYRSAYARLPQEIYSKLIDEKIATVTYKARIELFYRDRELP